MPSIDKIVREHRRRERKRVEKASAEAGCESSVDYLMDRLATARTEIAFYRAMAPATEEKPTQAQLDILQALLEARTVQVQVEIADRSGHSVKKVKEVLPGLEAMGLIARPYGQRMGYAPTDRGRDFYDSSP